LTRRSFAGVHFDFSAQPVHCRFRRSRRALGEVSAILRGKVPLG
jgi:hypothetical protein